MFKVKHEYMIVVKPDTADPGEIERTLDEKARQGWFLIQVAYVGTDIYHYMIRELP